MLGGCASVEQEALDELSSTEASHKRQKGRHSSITWHVTAAHRLGVTVVVAAGRGRGLAGVAALLLGCFCGSGRSGGRSRRGGGAAAARR